MTTDLQRCGKANGEGVLSFKIEIERQESLIFPLHLVSVVAATEKACSSLVQRAM